MRSCPCPGCGAFFSLSHVTVTGGFLATVLSGTLPFSLPLFPPPHLLSTAACLALRHPAIQHQKRPERKLAPEGWSALGTELSSVEGYHPTLDSGQPSEEGDHYAKFKDDQE